MEALKLKTIGDLLMCGDERVELIGGEIVRRPMARFQHGIARAASDSKCFHCPRRPDSSI